MIDKASASLENGRTAQSVAFLRRVKPSTLPPDVRAEYHERFSLALQTEGDFQKALTLLKQPIALYKKTQQNFLLARACLKKGDLLRQLEKFSDAYRAYDEGQKNAAVLSHKKVPGAFALTMEAALGKAMAVRGEGKFYLAAQWLDDLRLAFTEQKDKEAAAYATWALGTTQRFLGRLSLAEKNLKASVKLYERLKSPEGLAYARCGLGGALRMKGEASVSQTLYRSAYQSFKKSGDLFGQAYSSCGQASALRVRGKFSQAKPHFARAIRLYKSLNQKGPLGFVLWGQAQQLLATQNKSQAWKKINNARRLFRAAKDTRGDMYCDLAMGQIWEGRNDSKSSFFFKLAYKKAKKMNLLLEMGHAKRGLHSVNVWPYYKALGALPKKLSLYHGLP